MTVFEKSYIRAVFTCNWQAEQLLAASVCDELPPQLVEAGLKDLQTVAGLAGFDPLNIGTPWMKRLTIAKQNHFDWKLIQNNPKRFENMRKRFQINRKQIQKSLKRFEINS